MVMKKIALITLLSGSTIFLNGCINVFRLSDLRTETSIDNTDTALAKKLVIEMGKAHGIENWTTVKTYEVLLEDEFFGLVGKMGSPYDTDTGTVLLKYTPGEYDGQMRFERGKRKGQTYGINSGQTYELNAQGDMEYKPNKTTEFWLPTYQYFIEFPMRIQTATAFNYAGEMEVNGIKCKGVIASWDTIAPQKKLDQYVIWINAETHHIVKLEYTIRDVNKFVTGATYFEDYQLYDGIYMATQFNVESNLVKEGLLHEMRILELSTTKF